MHDDENLYTCDKEKKKDASAKVKTLYENVLQDIVLK